MTPGQEDIIVSVALDHNYSLEMDVDHSDTESSLSESDSVEQNGRNSKIDEFDSESRVASTEMEPDANKFFKPGSASIMLSEDKSYSKDEGQPCTENIPEQTPWVPITDCNGNSIILT